MLTPNADHNLPQKSHTVRLMEGTEKASGTEPQKAFSERDDVRYLIATAGQHKKCI